MKFLVLRENKILSDFWHFGNFSSKDWEIWRFLRLKHDSWHVGSENVRSLSQRLNFAD